MEAWEQVGFKVQFWFAPDYRDFPTVKWPRMLGLTCATMGHMTVWDGLAGQPGYHLIAEDDAMPTPRVADVVREAVTHTGFQVIKLFHFEQGTEPGVHPIAGWISATCYLVRDTADLMRRKVFVGAPDRLLNAISRSTAGVWPIPIIHVGYESSIPSW